MANYRVYEAAEELGVDSKQLIVILHQMDVRVRSHMSTVTDVQIARLRARLERERRGSVDEGEAESTGTRRRRRRRVAPQPVEAETAEALEDTQPSEADAVDSEPDTIFADLEDHATPEAEQASVEDAAAVEVAADEVDDTAPAVLEETGIGIDRA